MDLPMSSNTFSNAIKKETWKLTCLLSFQSLGVVYGRLSTAPLYVFGSIPPKNFKSTDAAYEYFSFIFWTLTITSLLKYTIIVLRADDEGEGGVFALYSLLCRHAKVGLLPDDRSANDIVPSDADSSCSSKVESRARKAIEKHKSSHYLMLFLALFGSCMMIGDAVFTPAISVLSASFGLQRSLLGMSKHFSTSQEKQGHIADAIKKYVPVPLACAILVCLFMLQHYGTRKIGLMFAPIVTIWLFLIGGVGIYNIFHYDPRIICAISPVYLYRFVKTLHMDSLRSLGNIVLCVAGSEAIFADLGHFSKKSIKNTFFCLIYPVLFLCYAGQAAFISKNMNVSNFNHLSESMPGKARHAFILLSLFASAVGSQASITASFSVIKQCLALGCFPRVKVVHTSDKIHGQVYIPDVNWLLMALSIAVTFGFRSIVLIGYGSGLAIVCGMLVTTCLMSLVIALCWEKNLSISALFVTFFGFMETVYLTALLLSFHKGSWCLAILVVVSLTIMLSWHYGTKKKYEFDVENKVSTEWLTGLSPGLGVSRVPGIGFVYTEIVTGIPAFFSHFITNLPAFHQLLIFVSFKSLPVPFVHPDQRYLIGRIGAKDYKIYRCIVRYGYCDHVRDTDDFEEQIIRSIGGFISIEENDSESLTSPEGRMIVVGMPLLNGNALASSHDNCNLTVGFTSLGNNESITSPVNNLSDRSSVPVRRKKVRFTLPETSPKLQAFVREELEQLIDARESGAAYFLGQSHLTAREGSSFLKRFLIMTYAFLDKNSREPHVALNIPHAALVEHLTGSSIAEEETQFMYFVSIRH